MLRKIFALPVAGLLLRSGSRPVFPALPQTRATGPRKRQSRQDSSCH